MKPYLVGIAGPSGAGKTFLAEHLVRALGNAVILPLDAYYPSLDELTMAERQAINFDDPAVLDSALLVQHATSLAQGEAIEQPIYDFAHHTRATQTRAVWPEDFVVLEGLFTFHWPQLRDLLKTRVYVDLSDRESLQRRLARDVAERGRSPKSVEEQFRTSVLPMAERYVRPTAAHAHILLRGDQPIAQEVAAVLEDIQSKR